MRVVLAEVRLVEQPQRGETLESAVNGGDVHIRVDSDNPGVDLLGAEVPVGLLDRL